MDRKRTRIIVSVVQSLVFLILALIVLYFGMHTLEDLLPLLIVLLIGLVLIFFMFRRSKFFKRK